MTTIGGSGTLLSGTSSTSFSANGTFNINNDWTGSWEVGSYSGSDWRNTITGGTWNLEGTAIDGALFDSNFTVTDGTTLTLVPEPSSFALLAGFMGLAWIMVRRRG